MTTVTINVNETAAVPPVDRNVTAGSVLKADDEKRYLLLVAYPAMKADTAVAADGHIDFAAPDVIEKAAHSFMRKGAKLGLWHQAGHDNAAECVESYVWPAGAPDWTQKAVDGTDRVVKAGDWLIGVICTPDTWAMYKAGRIGGASPQGGAKRRVPTPESLAALRS